MLKRHYRYSYSPIIERPTFEWPNYTRLAFYIALNIEHFSFGEGLGATLTPQTRAQPDVLNYAWRDYGNRVGVWYLLELFKQLDLPIALLVNSSAYDYCPQVIEAFRARGDEIVAHGRTNSEQQGILNQREEKALIREVTELITRKNKVKKGGYLLKDLSN